MSEDKESQANLSGRGCCGIIAAAVVFILLVAVGITRCGGDAGGGSSSVEAAQYAAKDICRTAVRQQLKAPSTAKFSSETTGIPGGTGGDLIIEVTGVVEAENSLGGTVGYDYTCTATVPSANGATVRGKVTSLTRR